MLNNKYQEILVGLNLVSLLRGIISVNRKRSTLLIDDKRFAAETNQESFLSMLELQCLTRLGKTYQIPELIDLTQFLVPGSLELVTENWRMKVGASPYENLRELLRKFPEFLGAEEWPAFLAEDEATFNTAFINELKRFETLSFEASSRGKGFRFELQGPKWFRSVYTNFGKYLNQEYDESKDLRYSSLLHLMGLSAEDKLKTSLSSDELPFYFFRFLSPLYRLQEFLLTTQLKRRLQLFGGDFKESSVQYWQLHEDKFENLLLESFEGVISGEKVLFFSHFPAEIPFTIKSNFALFRMSKLAMNRRGSSPYPPEALTLITDSHLLGSQEPFRMLARGKDVTHYHWPYPDLPGSKPDFYQRELLHAQDRDALFLPFEKITSVPHGVNNVTLDMRPHKSLKKLEWPVLTKLSMEIVESENPVKGFEYWGPYRYKSYGLLALCYGIEGL
jgi:hypothetical protein